MHCRQIKLIILLDLIALILSSQGCCVSKLYVQCLQFLVLGIKLMILTSAEEGSDLESRVDSGLLFLILRPGRCPEILKFVLKCPEIGVRS